MKKWFQDAGMTLTGGDTIAARCTMVSYRDRMTWVRWFYFLCYIFHLQYLSVLYMYSWVSHVSKCVQMCFIKVGATAEDEMCNFYLMYWVDGQEKLKNERYVILFYSLLSTDLFSLKPSFSSLLFFVVQVCQCRSTCLLMG